MLIVIVFVALMVSSGVIKAYCETLGGSRGRFETWLPNLIDGAAFGGLGAPVARYFGSHDVFGDMPQSWAAFLLLIAAAVTIDAASAYVTRKILRIEPKW